VLGALATTHKIPAWARRRVFAGMVSAVEHCRAKRVPVFIHAQTTLVAANGGVRIVLAPAAPDARYDAPETHFGLPPCVVWSLACVLFKLITGAPLVRAAPRDAMRVVGTARPVRLYAEGGPGPNARGGPVKPIEALLALFATFDAAPRWRNRPARLRIPRDATPTERAILARSLTWYRADADTQILACILEEPEEPPPPPPPLGAHTKSMGVGTRTCTK
jgi:hypothetical protein